MTYNDGVKVVRAILLGKTHTKTIFQGRHLVVSPHRDHEGLDFKMQVYNVYCNK